MTDESTSLKSVLGDRTANALKKHRALETVGDLLAFWPRRYRDPVPDLSNLHHGNYAVVVAEVLKAAGRTTKYGKQMLNVTITDGTHQLDLVYFGRGAYRPGHDLQPGVRAVFAGRVTQFGQRLQLAHPEYDLLAEDDDAPRTGPIPIYLQVKGIQNWRLSGAVRIVLDHLADAADPLPAPVLTARRLPERLTALQGIHAPTDRREIGRAQHRMKYEEAFVLQTLLAQRRADAATQVTRARVAREGGLLDAFDERLPFELTDGQREIGAVLAQEMARDTPMHRLLQGEVGSGKTVIALRAMLAAVDAGGQAALLAPTEVLAAQHHRSITAMLGDLAEGGMLGGSDVGTRVALLTGSQTTASRRANLLDAASGQAGIVVGTHALIQEHVQFADLALVVVDEQHRFGVEQRDALRAKGTHPPHMLVMTATPIPRTVAMTVFGDLETSTLRELPRGRSPIATHVVAAWKPGWVDRTWARVAEECRAGRQAYVVCPRIGDEDGDSAGLAGRLDDDEVPDVPTGRAPDADPDSDGANEDSGDPGDPGEPGDEDGPPPPPPAGVHAVAAALRDHPELEGLTIGVLHGRMPPEDKDATMTAFGRGEVDVLVSTTVIEVGVDVPNATVMVVMDAERFGISQLHQLRGRIGRGAHAGVCLLMTATEAETAGERLDALAATTDGFELARLDLSQRREGDVLGARQSGGSQLRFISVLEDEDLIVQAREDASVVVADDPTLADHPDLAAAVARRVDAEQAAYLERG